MLKRTGMRITPIEEDEISKRAKTPINLMKFARKPQEENLFTALDGLDLQISETSRKVGNFINKTNCTLTDVLGQVEKSNIF